MKVLIHLTAHRWFPNSYRPHDSSLLFFLSPSDSLCFGKTDEGVLVPEPVCQAHGVAHQEDPGQDSQLSGEGQGVVRDRAVQRVMSGIGFNNWLLKQEERDKGREDICSLVIQLALGFSVVAFHWHPAELEQTFGPVVSEKASLCCGTYTSYHCVPTDLNCGLLLSVNRWYIVVPPSQCCNARFRLLWVWPSFTRTKHYILSVSSDSDLQPVLLACECGILLRDNQKPITHLALLINANCCHKYNNNTKKKVHSQKEKSQ